MSIYVLSHVLKHSEARLGARLTLIALAEFAHDDGTKAFPSTATLVERTRLSKTGVKDALRKLREDGEIEQTGTTRGGVNIYRIIMHVEQGGSDSAPGQMPTPGGSDTAPNPSVNRHGLRPEEGERASAPKRVGGRAVNPEQWQMTVAVLADFNRQTGRKLDAVTGTGEPSEAAKRVYGRIRAFPQITIEQHADIIRRTLASRWWGDGPASIGVVYGPKVFEENMTRPAAASRTGGAPNGAAASSTGSARLRAMADELERGAPS